MIVDFLLDMIEGVLTWIAGLFPEVSWDPIAALAQAFSLLGGLNYFVPIAEMAAVTLAFIAMGAPMLLVTLAIWVIALLRGGSARG